MKRNFQTVVKSAVALATVVAAGMANAAVDITADTTAAKADISEAGALIIGVMVAVAVISWIRRVIR